MFEKERGYSHNLKKKLAAEKAKKNPDLCGKLNAIHQNTEVLKKGQTDLKKGQANLGNGQKVLSNGQNALRTGQENLTQGQGDLKDGQNYMNEKATQWWIAIDGAKKPEHIKKYDVNGKEK